jgi:hypothetical protein
LQIEQLHQSGKIFCRENAEPCVEFVIPGRAKGAGPEFIITGGAMDFGLDACASRRNDDVAV